MIQIREEFFALTYSSTYKIICIGTKPECQFGFQTAEEKFVYASSIAGMHACYMCIYKNIGYMLIKNWTFHIILDLQLSLIDQLIRKQPAQYPGKFGVQESFLSIASIKLQYSNKGYRVSGV